MRKRLCWCPWFGRCFTLLQRVTLTSAIIVYIHGCLVTCIQRQEVPKERETAPCLRHPPVVFSRMMPHAFRSWDVGHGIRGIKANVPPATSHPGGLCGRSRNTLSFRSWGNPLEQVSKLLLRSASIQLGGRFWAVPGNTEMGATKHGGFVSCSWGK